jgi:prepilin-type processing-associated H-X9-DG protein
VVVCGGYCVVDWFASAAHHRHHTRGTACLSNLRQLGAALMEYADDNAGRLPPKGTWVDACVPRVRSAWVFCCREDADRACSYSINRWVEGKAVSGKDAPLPAEAWVGVPLLFDSDTVGNGWNSLGGLAMVAPRHESGANFAFADGHAKRQKPEDYARLTWEPASGGTASAP